MVKFGKNVAENRIDLADNLKKSGSAEPEEPAFSKSAFSPLYPVIISHHML